MSRLSSWTAADVAAKLSGSGKQKARPTRDGYKVCCPAHDDGTPSLHLSDSQGKLLWYCFGGCSSDEVRDAIEKKLNGEEPAEREATPSERREKVEDRWAVVFPVPESARFSIDDFQHAAFGRPSQVWTYRMPGGQIAGWIARYDLAEGEKEVIPFVWGRNNLNGNEEPIRRSMPDPRPLYNLDLIDENPEKTVMFSEGEKAADAAKQLFPDWIHTTLPGGGNAIRLVDLSPLSGRLVVVLPDHDGPGYNLLLALLALAPEDADIRMMVWPSSWPRNEHGERLPYIMQKGDDAADHLKAGWDRRMLRQAVQESGQALIHRIQELPAPFEISHRR